MYLISSYMIGFLCNLDLHGWWYIYCSYVIHIHDPILLDVNYLSPNNRNLFPAKNEEFVRLRMKDAIASTVHEEVFGN